MIEDETSGHGSRSGKDEAERAGLFNIFEHLWLQTQVLKSSSSQLQGLCGQSVLVDSRCLVQLHGGLWRGHTPAHGELSRPTYPYLDTGLQGNFSLNQ